MKGIVSAALVAIVVAAALPGSALAEVVNDLSILRVTSPSSHRIGSLVRVTVIAVNAGPDDAESLDVSVAQPSALQLVSETCQGGISADTPSCEYGSVPAGDTRRTRLTLRIVGSVEGVATTTVCVTSEQFPNPDPEPANNCVPLAVAVR
jgi:Domain of unknown function DUF11